MAGPFKMKGSPMQRNFGISPVKGVTDPKVKKKTKNKPELPKTWSDTSTVGNPLNPAMISYLGREGLTKEEINVLHKAHERKLKKKQ